MRQQPVEHDTTTLFDLKRDATVEIVRARVKDLDLGPAAITSSKSRSQRRSMTAGLCPQTAILLRRVLKSEPEADTRSRFGKQER